MVDTNRYGAISAEIYDLDKPPGRLADTAFHLERLASISGPILEPACGSGRTMLPLLQAGLDVTGFDPSEDMLVRCEARCASAGFSPPLDRQRFETFHYDSAFAAILVPAGSFSLINRTETALAVLTKFYAHLEPGGVLILDVQGLRFLTSTSTDRRRWTNEQGEILTLEGVRIETDWLDQRAETLYRYERWRDHRLVETELDLMVQRYWGLEELRLALNAVGFFNVVVSGGYRRGRTPVAADRVWTFEATRP